MSTLFEAGLVISSEMNDFDEMASSGRAWDQRYHQVAKGEFLGRSTIAHSAHVQLARTSYEPGIFINGSAPRGAYTFVSQVGGAPVYCHGKQLAPEHVHLMQPGSEFEFCAPRPCDILVFSVSAEVCDSYLQDFTGLETGQLSRQHRLHCEAPRHRLQLNSHWSSVLQQVSRNPAQLTGGCDHDLVSALLWPLFSSTAKMRSDSRTGTKRVANRAALAAARLVMSHVHRPIKVAELCAELGVAERTLQVGFRACYGCSPKAFISTMRFNHLRRALLSAPAHISVSEVMTRNGFSELGRCAVAYRCMFGESPSHTRRLNH